MSGKRLFLGLAAQLLKFRPAATRHGATSQWVEDCNAVANALAEGNRAFDRALFLNNCGVPPQPDAVYLSDMQRLIRATSACAGYDRTAELVRSFGDNLMAIPLYKWPALEVALVDAIGEKAFSTNDYLLPEDCMRIEARVAAYCARMRRCVRCIGATFACEACMAERVAARIAAREEQAREDDARD